MNKYVDMLTNMINDIENGNYSSDYSNGGISYSDNIKNIFLLLGDDYFKKIFNDNYRTYKVGGRELNQMDISKFNLIECVLYLSWLWHSEGSSLATGIINNKIKNGRYVLVLKRLKECIIENN